MERKKCNQEKPATSENNYILVDSEVLSQPRECSRGTTKIAFNKLVINK